MIQVDLHIHTTASDGLMNSCEIINLAKQKGMKAIAITDHDTIDGYRQALKCDNIKDIELIPGVEINTYVGEYEVHILGYYIDISDKLFLTWLKKLFDLRMIRAKKILDKFNNMGFKFTLDDVKQISKNGAIGRPHFARLLIKKGIVDSMEQAFDKYLLPGRPAYVQRYKISPKQAIEQILKNKAIPVIAHPGLIHDRQILQDVIDAGIMGMEVYHSKHTNEQTKDLLKIATQNNLLITGGSDFHGEINNSPLTIGESGIDYQTFIQLKNTAASK